MVPFWNSLCPLAVRGLPVEVMADKSSSGSKSSGKDTEKKASSGSSKRNGSSEGSKKLEKPGKSQETEAGKSNKKKEVSKGSEKSPYQFPSNINVPHGTTVLLDISKRIFYAKSGEIDGKNSAKSEVYPTIVKDRLEVHPLEEFKRTDNGYQVVCGDRRFEHNFPEDGFLLKIYQESQFNPPSEEHRATPKTVNYDGILVDLTKGKYYDQSSMKRVYPFVRYPEQVMIFRPIPLSVRSQSGAQVFLHESLGHAVVSSDETGSDQYYYHYAPPQPIKILIKPWNPDATLKK